MKKILMLLAFAGVASVASAQQTSKRLRDSI